jgi:Arc/MetJ family transcription regulator
LAVRKTTLEFDEDLYERARKALGTKGLKATVHQAFDEIDKRQRRMAHLERLRTGDGIDLDVLKNVRETAWRRDHPAT